MRAPGMQVLTDQIKAKRPGVTIYGIGDEEHQEHTSGHNEDDTPGVSAEDQDPDSIPEHRALDVMPGDSFSSADGDALVHDLTTIPENQVRIIYVNWGNYQYHRKNNFKPVWNGDNPHKHVHVSGEADADANIAPWVLSDWDDEMAGFFELDPSGISPDGEHRSPHGYLRDLHAAYFFGERPVTMNGTPVGPSPWEVDKLNAIMTALAVTIDYDLLAQKIVEKMTKPASPEQIADAVVAEIAS